MEVNQVNKVNRVTTPRPHTYIGGCMSNAGIRVHTGLPWLVVPKKEPLAVLSVFTTW